MGSRAPTSSPNTSAESAKLMQQCCLSRRELAALKQLEGAAPYFHDARLPALQDRDDANPVYPREFVFQRERMSLAVASLGSHRSGHHRFAVMSLGVVTVHRFSR